MGANRHANGGELTVPLDLPPFTDYAIPVPRPATEHHESTRQLGLMLRDIYRKNPATFRLVCPDETNSNRLGAVFEASKRCLMEPSFAFDERLGPEGRVMEVLSEHNCEGWLEGYILTGRHEVKGPAPDRLFAISTAYVTLQSEHQIDPSGSAAVPITDPEGRWVRQFVLVGPGVGVGGAAAVVDVFAGGTGLPG